jgi:hypothetical protein
MHLARTRLSELVARAKAEEEVILARQASGHAAGAGDMRGRTASPAGLLQRSRKDPFDRMMMAQVLLENVPLCRTSGRSTSTGSNGFGELCFGSLRSTKPQPDEQAFGHAAKSEDREPLAPTARLAAGARLPA